MNMKKFKKNETIRLIKHCKRTMSGRDDLDYSRTENNVNLFSRNIDEESYMFYRLKDVYIYGGANAKRTVYSCDWILTAPQEIADNRDECIRFFEAFTDFCADRYGKKNVLGSYCHFDEDTPHCHFLFMPIVYDEKKQREKLCVSDIMTKKELFSFHEEFQSYLYEHGMSYRVIYEDKRERLKSWQNRSVDDLKYEARERERERSRWE